MSKRIYIIALLTAFVAGQEAWAQRPVYRRAPTEEKHSRVGFSMRTLFGVDMQLKELGTVGFPAPANLSLFGDLDGKELEFFNDGYIIYNPDNPYTAEFKFAWANAHVVPDPTAFDQNRFVGTGFTLNRFQTTTTGVSAMAENTSKYGWEIFYDYQWGKSTDRIRYGIRAAIGFQNLDFTYQGTVEAMRNQQVFVISVANGLLSNAITYVPAEPGNDGSTGPVFYVGTEDGGAADILDPGSIDFMQGIISEGTVQDVNVAFNYDGVMAILRFGPTIDLKLIDDLHLELSAGVVGAYLNSRIGVAQRFDLSLTLPISVDTVIAPDEYFEDRSEFLVGFFAEGLLRYQLTPRVGFFGSMMYLNLPELKDPVIGTVTYDLTLSSPIMASAGMVLTF